MLGTLTCAVTVEQRCPERSSPGSMVAIHSGSCALNVNEVLCTPQLMHLAAYLTHLETTGYITPPMKKWVDLIRKHRNDSTHKLDPPNEDRAESTLMLTTELLRIVYEMEHMATKYVPKPKPKP